MHSASATRTIDAPAVTVWAVVDDFAGVADYNPNVESARLTGEASTGEGASRRCTLAGGGHLDETIVAYDPGSAYTVAVDGSFPLRELRVELRVAADGEESSRATMTARYRPRYGPLGWAMARTVMRWRFERLFAGTLAGLADHVTAGSDGVADAAVSTGE
jgi:uncharacterized protein YndB with AHSA1/START domain